MRVLVVSRTVGPAKSLARVTQSLLDRNHEVAAVLSKDEGSMVYAPALMGFNPDVVLLSTSSANISDELAVVVQARQKNIPFAVFADTYGAYRRPDFTQDFRDSCSMLFVPDVAEAKAAGEDGFTNNIVVSGVPLWEDFADSANFPSREEVRRNLGIADDEIAVVWTPGKDGELNKEVFSNIFDALSRLEHDHDAKLVFLPRFHPGDQNVKNNPNYYDDVLSNCPARVVDSSLYKKSEDLVPALDLIISSASTLGIMGIYQRKRVIEYLPSAWQDRLEKQTGRRTWPPAECGAAYKAESLNTLLFAIAALLFTDFSYANLRKLQETTYPVQKGSTAKRIIEALEKLVSSRREEKVS